MSPNHAKLVPIIKKKLPKFKNKEIKSRGDFLATGTVYLKSILKKFNYYNEKTKNSGLENYELILRIINENIKGKRIPKNLFFHRRHKKNLSKIKKKKILQYGIRLFKFYNIGMYKINKNHPYIY